MNEKYKEELESTLEWLKASLEYMHGELYTNALFTIEKIKKVLNK